MDRWLRDLSPGSIGWLGSTAGATQDGRFIALARFDSEEAAQRNSTRPEQDAWWADTSGLLDEVTFHNSTRADADLAGDPDRAGFVQVIQGRNSDAARARELMAADPELWARYRPDVLGTLTVEYDDGGFTTAIYFTNEEEARAGERKEMPSEIQAQMAEMQKLSVGEPEFFDLKQPWLYASR
jgi:hypothetical protein